MKIRLNLIFVCVLLVIVVFIIYSFSDIDFNEEKPEKFINLKVYEQALNSTITYHSNESDGWPFIISKNYNDSDTRKWSEPIPSTNYRRYDVGELGAGYVPSDDKKELMEALHKEHQYNLLASDMISLHRSLPDVRSKECQSLTYPEKLPTTSVIIIFHNEGWSTLFRTIWSIIDRSPPELIKEIILVDDFSTWSHLKRPLDDYIELLPVDLTLIRTTKREGLIRARLIGAQHATVSFMVFKRFNIVVDRKGL